MKTDSPNIERAVSAYGSMLYRLALGMLRTPADAEDAVQETFIKYLQKAPGFQSEAHEKAWLIRVCVNRCRDMLRASKRRKNLPDAAPATTETPPETGIMDALSKVPEKFRLPLLLHYAEGYSVSEIASIIRRTPSAVKMRLQKGRRMLEEIYRREYM